MTLADVFAKSLRSIGEYTVGFVLFLAGLLEVLHLLGFEIPLAAFYNNLDSNGKFTLMFALMILINSTFFAITIFVINRLVKEIDKNNPSRKTRS